MVVPTAQSDLPVDNRRVVEAGRDGGGRRADLTRDNDPWGRLLLLICLVASLLLSAMAIMRESGVVPAWPMDQSFAQIADLAIRREEGHWVFHYPNLQNSGGITSVLIAGLYKLVIPTTISNLNWHIRILGMAGYLVSGFWLIQKLLRSTATRLLAFVLIAASGYQFVQPTSELFGATCLNLFLVFALGRLPVLPTSALLVSYGLCKVELIPSSLCLAGLWMWHEWKDSRRRLLIPVSVAAWFFVFVFPSVLLNGGQTLSGGRSWEAFKVKYTSLFHPHQLNPPSSDPWGYSHETIDKIFPDNRGSLLRVILKYPRLYLDYLLLAILQSLINVLAAVKLLAVPALLLIRKRSLNLNSSLRFAALALLIVVVMGLGPAIFMGFIHFRYVMRYYPLIVAVLIGIGLDRSASTRWEKPLIWICAIATLVIQLMQLPMIYTSSHAL